MVVVSSTSASADGAVRVGAETFDALFVAVEEVVDGEVFAVVEREDGAALSVFVAPAARVEVFADALGADVLDAFFAVVLFAVAVFAPELLAPVVLVLALLAPEDVDVVPGVFAADVLDGFLVALLLFAVPLLFAVRVLVRAGVFSAAVSEVSSVGADEAARAAAERRPPVLPVRLRRSAAARAIPVARSWAPARSRRALSSSRETFSPEKNMSTGRLLADSPPELEGGRVRVRSSCSGAGVEPAPGIRAPSPRPSPRFCVMAVVLPRNVSPSGCPRIMRAIASRPVERGQGAEREFSS